MFKNLSYISDSEDFPTEKPPLDNRIQRGEWLQLFKTRSFT